MRARLTPPAAALFLAAFGYAQDPLPNGEFPPPSEAQKARDEADYKHAITAYRFWYPTVSCEGIFNGNLEEEISDNESVLIPSVGPQAVSFSANSNTPMGPPAST
jgi:hypothetical protein